MIMVDILKLEEEVTLLEKNTISDGTPVLIEHLILKYDKDKLDIKPEYQRVFRRTKEQKSKFIESMLLWIPLPSMFVAEDENWKWELVDWLQRMSTILEFSQNQKFLKNYSDTWESILKGLEAGQYLKSLEWIVWSQLPEKYQNRILDTKIYIWILKNTWDIKAKFELFQRLNTWWTKLSNQEVRNCLLVDKNFDFYGRIVQFSQTLIFQWLIDNVKQEKIIAEEGTELVLRCLALQNIKLTQNIKIEKLIDDFVYKATGLETTIFNSEIDFPATLNAFDSMINLISKLDDRAFNKISDWGQRKNHFIYPLYDTISSGIAYNIMTWNIDPQDRRHCQMIKEKLINIQSNEEYLRETGIGKSSEMKLKFASIFGKEYFNLASNSIWI